MGFKNLTVVFLCAAALGSGGCGFFEEEGGSEPAQCKDGKTRCDGDLMQQCEEGQWTYGDLCLHGCQSGKCNAAPAVCEVGERRCYVNDVERCEGPVGHWEVVEECGYTCEESQCIDPPEQVCVPQELFCNQNQLLQCNANGSGWYVEQECPVMCENGECVGQAEAHVRGTISYEARLPEASGEQIVLGLPKQLPLGFVLVLVSDGTQFIGQSISKADGSFEVGITRPLQGGESLLFVPVVMLGDEAILLVAKPSYGGDPMSGEPDPWVWNLPLEGNHDLGDLIIKEESGSGAAYIFAINRAAIASVIGTNLMPGEQHIAPLAILWAPGVGWSCGACFSGNQQQFGEQVIRNSIFIGGEPEGSSAWGYAVLLHEFGHYVARNYSRDDSPGGSHTIGVPITPPFAWSEGWATFFAVSTFSRFIGKAAPLYWDIQGGGSFWIDLARLQFSSTFSVQAPDPSGGLTQHLDENWVAMMLWDLWDGADVEEILEPDGTALGTQAVVEAVTSSRFLYGDRGAQGADFVDFLDAVLCAQPELDGTVVTTVTSYLGFPYDGAWTCN